TDVGNNTLTGSSTAVTVNPASAFQLLFVQQPSNTVANSVISPAVTARITDQYGNTITGDNTDQVSVAIGTNPAGGSLSGTTPVTVSGGIATFSNLSINNVGNGYTLA